MPDPVNRIPINFNSRFLRRLAKALGTAGSPANQDHITLWIDPANLTLPMIVTTPDHKDRFGILMPTCRPDHTAPDDYRLNDAWQWANRDKIVAEAKAACIGRGEFWTAEKEEAALAAAGKEVAK